MRFHATTTRISEQPAYRRLLLASVTTLAVAGLAGCSSSSSGGNGGDDGAATDPDTYTIGGEVSGLDGGSVDITLNDDETLTLDSNGAFAFSSELEEGDSYSVSVDSHPLNSVCDLSGADGAVGTDNVSDVLSECEILTVGTVNRDGAIDLDWARAGEVDIAYSTDSGCDWTNASSCADGGVFPDQSGGSLTVGAGDGLVEGEVYSFSLMVGDQASRPTQGSVDQFELSGHVRDTVVANDRVYAGGDFLLHGAPIEGVVRFRGDGDEALLTGANTEVTLEGGAAELFDTVEDSEGGRFIGGVFDTVDGVGRTHIARLKPDGSVDESWNVTIIGDGITQLLLDESEGHLYIAGAFSEVAGNASYANLARLQLNGNLDTSFSADSPDDLVWAMDASSDMLYLGGAFNNIGSETRQFVGAVNLADGTVSMDFDPQLDDSVSEVLYEGDRVYLGGSFATVGGESQESMAAVDSVDGAMVSDFNPVIDGIVYALELLDGDILAGGAFNNVNGSTRNGFAILDPQTGNLRSGWDTSMEALVVDIMVDDDFLYLGGAINEVDGSERFGVTRFHRDSQGPDHAWVPMMDANVIWSIDSGENITMVGNFRGASGHRVDNVAAYELANGDLDESFDVGANDTVRAMVASGQKLFFTGHFDETYSGGSTFANVHAAAVGISDGSDQGWQPAPDGNVYAMVANSAEDTLYLGGNFDSVDGQARENLAAVGMVDGAVASTPDPAINHSVMTLAWADGYDTVDAVIAGGTFTSAGGESRNRHAVFSSDLQDVHPEALDPDNTVYSVDYSSSENYQLLGGAFDNVAGQAQGKFAAFENETTFDASAPDVSAPAGDDLVRSVSINASAGRVIAGGRFSQFGGDPRTNLAIMDYTSGSGLSLSNETLDTDGDVLSIEQTPDYVVLGGEFRHLGGERHAGLAVLDATSLEAVHSAPASVSKMSQSGPLVSSNDRNRLLEELEPRGK